MNFYIGQKVVCVRPVQPLIKDTEYTIAGFLTIAGDVGVFLLEAKHKDPYCAFNITRFRPLLTDSIEFAEATLKKLETQIEVEQLILN